MISVLKTITRLIVGLFVVIPSFYLIAILFTELIKVRDIQSLIWFPLLMSILGFFLAGVINRKTKLVLIPILFLSLAFFIVLRRQLYFPLYLLFIFSLLSVFITRKEINRKIRVSAFVILFILFGHTLLSQPFIIEKKDFGTDFSGNLYNAIVLWDFSNKKPLELPACRFTDIDGKIYKLDEFKEKTLYVTFWATWCGPCLGEKTKLEKLKKKYQDNSDIVFIDISIDSNKKNWKKYLDKNKPEGLQLYAEDGFKVYSDFQFAGIPHYIIVNKKHNFKACMRPSFFDERLLTDSLRLTSFIDAPYKVFKKTNINGKDTTILVK